MTDRRPPARRAPFGLAAVLSLALHGAALGAVLWVGIGTAPEPIALETVPMVIVEAPATSDQPPAKATATLSQTAQADTPPPAPEPKQSSPAPARTAAAAKPLDAPEPASKPVPPALTPPARKPAIPTPKSGAVPVEPKARSKSEPESKPAPTQSAALPEDSALEETASATGEPLVTEKPPRYGVDGLANPSPAYPWLSRRAGEQGRVVVRVAVKASGEPGHVEIVKSSGHARLDEAALDALREWKFRPARRGGRPVPGTVEVPVTFRLSGN